MTEIRIETERLILRPPTMEDFPRWAELQADPDATRFIGGPKTPAETWATYAPLFHAHSTPLMTPELLAAPLAKRVNLLAGLPGLRRASAGFSVNALKPAVYLLIAAGLLAGAFIGAGVVAGVAVFHRFPPGFPVVNAGATLRRTAMAWPPSLSTPW